MHLTRNIKLLFPILIIGSPMTGQPTNAGLELDAIIELAFRNNHDLAMATLEIERAKSRLRWSGDLPNPELGISSYNDRLGLNEGEHSLKITFRQQYPLTSRLRDEKKLRHAQVLLAEAELAEHRRQLASRVAIKVVQLVSSREYIQHQDKHADLQSAITRLLRTLVQRAEASSLDLGQAELDSRQIEQKRRTFQARARSQRLQLNQLIGMEPSKQIRFQYSLDLPSEPSGQSVPLAEILTRRPDHALALANIHAADNTLTLEKARQLEDMTVSVFVEQERSVDEPSGLDSNTFAGIGISIPLPLRQKNEGRIEQAEMNYRAAGEAAAALRFLIQSEYHSARQQHMDAWRIASEAKGEILRLARKNYDDFRLAYLDGQVGLLQVQRAREQLLELQQEALEAAVHFHQAEARLRKVTGNLPTQGFDTPPNKP